MKYVGVIPARYESSRLRGKPLSDICGKPMIWWTYHQASEVKGLDCIVATDDSRIADICKQYEIPYVLTGDCDTHISRIQEVSEKVDADYYIVICGDEPLIEPEVISNVLPKTPCSDVPYVGALMRKMTEPTEVNDPGNIKVVVNSNNEAITLSRSPIPFPYKTVMYSYLKTIGVECYNKAALDFFVKTEQGPIEKIEDVTLLRFIENHITIHYSLVESRSLSVDTSRDLEKVRKIISDSLKFRSW